MVHITPRVDACYMPYQNISSFGPHESGMDGEVESWLLDGGTVRRHDVAVLTF